MQFIEGKYRTQSVLFPESLDQIIEQDNEVRMIDLLIKSITLVDFKFIIKTSKEGRPAYHPKDLLKLFNYKSTDESHSCRLIQIRVPLLWANVTSDPDAIRKKGTARSFCLNRHWITIKPSEHM